MKKIFLFVIGLFLLTACTQEPTPALVYAQVTAEPIIPLPIPESNGIKTYEYQDPLETGIWQSSSEVPSEIILISVGGRLQAEFDTQAETAALLNRGVSDISSPIDGFTITLTALERPFRLVAGIRESDESWYHTTLLIYPEDGTQTFEIDFNYLALDQNSTDENYRLDKTQIAEIILVDISGYTGPFGKGTILIDEIVYWRGNPVLPQLFCSAETTERSFLMGADASFIPSGELIGQEWFVNGEQVDPIQQMALQGVNAFRLRTWVGEEGESRLDYATALGLRAQGAGMQIAPVLFLTDYWADISSQPVPEVWQGLTLNEQAEAVQRYTFETVSHFLEAGIRPIYYEIGNEIDFGISGVYAELGSRSIGSLQSEYWIDSANLILAAQAGIRQADPDARFMLHIAKGSDPHFALAFFQSMRSFGVQLDLVGVSFYPAANGVFAIEGLCSTINRVQSEMGLPVVIAEFGYPASIPQAGLFSGWRHPLPGYPLNPGGQASYISAFFSDMRSHPNVVGVYLFEPAFYWEPEIWEPFALFDENGEARPALGTFTLP